MFNVLISLQHNTMNIMIMIVINNYDLTVKFRSISTIYYRYRNQGHFSVETGEMLAESKGVNIKEVQGAYH